MEVQDADETPGHHSRTGRDCSDRSDPRIRCARIVRALPRDVPAVAGRRRDGGACDQRSRTGRRNRAGEGRPVSSLSLGSRARPAGSGRDGRGRCDINNAGRIASSMVDPNGNDRAFLWEPGKGRTLLGTLGGKTSYVMAINSRDQIVGTSETAAGLHHAFLWDKDAWHAGPRHARRHGQPGPRHQRRRSRLRLGAHPHAGEPALPLGPEWRHPGRGIVAVERAPQRDQQRLLAGRRR